MYAVNQGCILLSTYQLKLGDDGLVLRRLHFLVGRRRPSAGRNSAVGNDHKRTDATS